jgi:eukaryotic-like serine/threonine-protein kinase
MDRWQRVQSLFLTAVDLPPDEQRRFLESECGDAELRLEVEDLVLGDRDGAEALTTAVESEAARLIEFPMQPGDRVGAYRTVSEIGRGGMGVVYLATRDDDQYRKHVAIKIVKLGMDTVEVLRRFRYERQILANLDHPNIAHLLDAGTTREGRPFFVMEYVNGQPIDRYCAARDLDIEARSRLFLRVTDAVAYAHRSLVVHRDLKPANILITADGTPKLLDFGVAKLLNADAENGLTATIANRPMTPAYASPEQARGETVTTATDVYSLGAVLHELLKAANTKLDGDLENIVAMAMRTEPERRYASVDQFAEDLRRYLSGWPVMARQGAVVYRARKFLRRQRYLLTAAALIVLSLLGGVLASFSETRKAEAARRVAEMHQRVAERERETARTEHARAEQERDSAVSERTRAEFEEQRARDRLTQMLTLSNGSLADISTMERRPATFAARQEFAQRTLTFLEKLSAEAGADERLRAALSTAYLRLGVMQSDMQSVNPGGVSTALNTYRKGAEMVDPASAGTRNPELLQLWLELEHEIAKLLIETGRIQEADSVLRRAEGFSVGLIRAQTGRPALRDALRIQAYLHFRLAAVLESSSDFPRAFPYSIKALDEFEAAVRKFPGDAELLHDLSAAETRVGFDLKTMGELEKAVPHYERTVELRERLSREHPDDVTYRRTLMLAYDHLASLLASPLQENLGQPELARKYFAKAGVLAEAALVDSPNHPSQFDYAEYLLNSSIVEVPPERLAESLAGVRRAATLLESFAAAAPDVVKYHREVANADLYIGHRLRALGRYEEAIAAYQRVQSQTELILSSRPEDRFAFGQSLEAEGGIARSLALAGDRTGAVNAAGRMVAHAQQGLAFPFDADVRKALVAEAHLTLAEVHREFQNWADARKSAQLAIVLLRPIAANGDRWSKRLLRDADALAQPPSGPDR